MDIPFISRNGSLETTQATPVTAATAPNFFLYSSGTNVNATVDAFNFIKIFDPVNTGAATTAQQAFSAAMGGGALTVLAGTDEVLTAFFDVSHGDMVLITVDANGTMITGGDDVDVVAVIGMSQATFNAFNPNNLDFVTATKSRIDPALFGGRVFFCACWQ